MMDLPETQAILLDDAFSAPVRQALRFNILLTEFSLPFTRDYLLPSTACANGVRLSTGRHH